MSQSSKVQNNFKVVTRFEQEQLEMLIDRNPIMRKLTLARIVLITLCVTGILSTLSGYLTDSESPLTGLAYTAMLAVLLFLVQIARKRVRQSLYKKGVGQVLGKGPIQ